MHRTYSGVSRPPPPQRIKSMLHARQTGAIQSVHVRLNNLREYRMISVSVARLHRHPIHFDATTGSPPRRMMPARIRTHRKFEYPSTRCPVLNTAPCPLAMFRAYRNDINGSSVNMPNPCVTCRMLQSMMIAQVMTAAFPIPDPLNVVCEFPCFLMAITMSAGRSVFVHGE